jgi:prepilin-type N-terminal cleavage/methylation domain-containing protein
VNKKGFALIEAIVAIVIVGLIAGTATGLMVTTFKTWKMGEEDFDVLYNCKETLNVLEREIRESYGVEIIDQENGWIKVFKNEENSKFTSFKIKNNKIFVGFNSMLNSNSELSRHVSKFKVSYIPSDVTNYKDAKGVKINLKFLFDKKTYNIDTSFAFRNKQ